MNRSFAKFSAHLGFFLYCLNAIAAREADGQLSGMFQTTPGTVGSYTYHAGTYESVAVPVDLTVSFSSDNPTSALSATIRQPLISVDAQGAPIYPIATYFPMRVTGTSSNGHVFHGDLIETQYLFDWEIGLATGGELLLNGRVFWAGGRYEQTTITNARLIPSLAGDYNRDDAVNAADYVVWRKNEETTNPLPNDPIGGTIGQPQYDLWLSGFGQTLGSGRVPSANAVVPEPATLLLLTVGILVTSSCRRTFYKPIHE